MTNKKTGLTNEFNLRLLFLGLSGALTLIGYLTKSLHSEIVQGQKQLFEQVRSFADGQITQTERTRNDNQRIQNLETGDVENRRRIASLEEQVKSCCVVRSH